MANEKVVRKWSELKGLKVTIPSEGRNAGEVEDFYFQPGTNSIYALSVRTRLEGIMVLPATSIKEFVSDAVIIDSEQMLSRRIPPFTLGTTLLSSKAKGEDGKETGTITDILIRVIPPVALHVSGFEVAEDGKRSSRRKILEADAVIHYKEGTIVLDNQTARKF